MVCRCKAYPFPHRIEGGKCNAVTQDSYWPERPRRRNIDHILDDPRRGQAEWIKRLP